MTLLSVLNHTFKEVLPLITVRRESFANDYFQAMNYLKTHGDYQENVLELPLEPKYAEQKSFQTWFNGSSVHIASFGNKRMYIGNQLTAFPDMPVEERLAFISLINKTEYMKKPDNQIVNKLIKEIKNRNISYIYTNSPLKIFSNNSSVAIVFKNPSAIIYKVK